MKLKQKNLNLHQNVISNKTTENEDTTKHSHHDIIVVNVSLSKMGIVHNRTIRFLSKCKLRLWKNNSSELQLFYLQHNYAHDFIAQ